MLFADKKLIFVHAPKTAGNFFSKAFLKYSSDELRLNDRHDGIDRFELTGDTTYHKHQSLTEYADQLGGDLRGWEVYSVARRPVDRMMSLYYSPHHWLKKDADGRLRPNDEGSDGPVDLAKFKEMLSSGPSLKDMLDQNNLDRPLKLDEQCTHASGAKVTLIPFSELRKGLEEFAEKFGFDSPDFPDRPLNASINPAKKSDAHLMQPELEAAVMASHHGADSEIFAH